jgi:hypothetical protein
MQERNKMIGTTLVKYNEVVAAFPSHHYFITTIDVVKSGPFPWLEERSRQYDIGKSK